MLETRDIVLVPMDVADITEEYVGWLNDPSTFRLMLTKFGQTRTTVRQYVESVHAPNLLCRIVRKSDKIHVGNIGLHRFDPVHRRMDLGIMVGAADARGTGIGTQACSVLIAHAFDHLNLHKVTAGTVDENVAMKQVFLGLGFRIEGTLAEHYYLEGRYHDVLCFGLLRDQFTRRHED
jgi:RimJ/RimL family protein N-acetyltransferase